MSIIIKNEQNNRSSPQNETEQGVHTENKFIILGSLSAFTKNNAIHVHVQVGDLRAWRTKSARMKLGISRIFETRCNVMINSKPTPLQSSDTQINIHFNTWSFLFQSLYRGHLVLLLSLILSRRCSGSC